MTGGGTILVVDDTSESLRLLTDILTAEGYRVRPADSGELALAAVAAETPDLILLDIRMPGIDGFEVFRRLRAEETTRDIPVMFISASTDVDDRVAGLRLGAVDFVTKPIRRDELLARVQTHLELHRLREGLGRHAAELQLANESLEAEATERRRAEAALRESEARFRLLFESLTTGFALHEIIRDAAGTPCDYRFLSVNPAFEALVGRTAEELVGRTVLEALPGTEPAWIERYGRVVTTREPAEFEDYASELDRTYHVVAYSPEPERFAVIVQDITERKRAEEALRESEARYRAVADSATDAIITIRGIGEIVANAAATRVFGYADRWRSATRGAVMPERYHDVHGARDDTVPVAEMAELRGEARSPPR